MKAKQKYLGLAGWLGLCYLTGLIGSRFQPDDWYASLSKPSFTPSGWVFPVVWNILYTMMGIAAWLVWLRKRVTDIRVPISLFLAQLAVNGSWSWVFFGLHQLGASVVVIASLFSLVIATMVGFWRVRPASGWLLFPYALWLVFAGVINVLVWKSNR